VSSTIGGLLESFSNEIQFLLRVCLRLVPLLLLLFVVFFLHHVVGLLYACWCFAVANTLNRMLKLQVSLQREADWVTLTHIFFGLLTHILGTLYFFGDISLFST